MRVELGAASALFFLLFAALAVIVPFGPLAFSVMGLSPTSIALMASMASFAKISVPIVVGPWADLRGRCWALQCTTIAAVILAASMSLLSSTEALLMGVYATYIGAVSAQMPLVEVLTYEALGEHKAQFARIRVWGSIGFTVALVATGWFSLAQWPLGFFGLVVLLQLLSLFVVMTGLKTVSTPNLPKAPSVTGVELVVDGIRTIRRVSLGWFIVGTMLSYCGFGIYDTYYALRLQSLGFEDAFIGYSIAIGVGAEVVLMFLAPRYLSQFNSDQAVWLTLIGAATASVRWLVISVSDEPWILLSVQPLHAISFGVWFLGVVAHGQGKAPDDARARVQGMTNAAVGAGGLVGVSIGGWFVSNWGFDYGFLVGMVCSGLAAGVYAYVILRQNYASRC